MEIVAQSRTHCDTLRGSASAFVPERRRVILFLSFGGADEIYRRYKGD
jgi:hypothetical protein